MRLAKSGICPLIIFLGSFCLPLCAGADDDPSDQKTYEYWKTGGVKSCTIYDKENEVMARAVYRPDGMIEKIEKYDRYNNKIEEALYDEDGRLRAGLDGWAAMRWAYDERTLLYQTWYDEHGKAIKRKHYSESGRLVASQVMSESGYDFYEDLNTRKLLGKRALIYYTPEGKVESQAIVGQ